jgi:tetratricopeptide (TPR) repeat protein
LPGAIARLIELDHDQAENLLPYLPSAGSAAKHYLAGLAALQVKDAAAAITSLEQARSAAPQFAAGQNALGWAYWLRYLSSGEEAQLQQSIATLETATQLAPRWWRPVFNLGDIYRLTGQNDNAIAAFDAALELDPANPLVCRRMADVLRAEKRQEEAEQFLRVAIDAYPDYFEAHRLLALYFYRIGEGERAAQHMETTLTYAPDYAFAHNVLGAIYQERGDFVNARKMFDRAFRLLPNCDTCCNVGLMLYFEKRYRDSASYYEYALEYCGPDRYDIWANWATALYWVDGERKRSIELFRTAIDLASAELQQDPDNTVLIQDLIGYHAMIGDDTTTRRLIARAESSGTIDDELLYTIGTAYEIMGDRIAALRYLADAVRHGYPVARINGTRELEDLFEDPRFQRMIAAESEEDRSSSPDN